MFRRRLLEIEAAPVSTSIAGQPKERTSLPSPVTRPGVEIQHGGDGLRRRREVATSNHLERGTAEENMDAEQDMGRPPDGPMDKEEDIVFRPPLRGVRKQLSTKPTPSGTTGIDFCETPEYKRITEMITELVDIRARLGEGGGDRRGSVRSSSGAPSLIRTRASRDAMVDAENGVAEIGKKKKKKNKGGTNTEGTSEHNLGSGRRVGRNNDADNASQQPNIGGRRGSIPRPPPQQTHNEDWATVIRRRGGANKRPPQFSL